MLCYISQPNGQCLEFNIDIKQIGQVVLDKVLESLGILEGDYLGLQYRGPKGEELWLNLRNRVCDHDMQCSHVCRLSLRVKFFVQPHLIQQESTKELFYTQAKETMTKGLISLMAPECDEAKLARIVASIAQADSGDQICNVNQKVIYFGILKQICPGSEPTLSLIEKICAAHSKLHGMPRAGACYHMLKHVSSLPGYGVEEHKVTNAQGVDFNFRVGPEGITLCDCKTKVESKIPYTQVHLATHNDKAVHIELLDDAGNLQCQECFKLISRKAAVALYRSITEMHSFYRCDTVGSDVHSQYSRDFKGTFVSMFNENSKLGKRYIFDIQRTGQEAYDLVRRKLYAKSSSPTGSPIHYFYSPISVVNKNDNFEDSKDGLDSIAIREPSDCNKNLMKEIKHLKQRLEDIEESLICCICRYHKIDVVLLPCGHMICDICSKRIDLCPQCRTAIEHCHKVFHNFGLECEKT